jgi:hypothetical protein
VAEGGKDRLLTAHSRPDRALVEHVTLEDFQPWMIEL